MKTETQIIVVFVLMYVVFASIMLYIYVYKPYPTGGLDYLMDNIWITALMVVISVLVWVMMLVMSLLVCAALSLHGTVDKFVDYSKARRKTLDKTITDKE